MVNGTMRKLTKKQYQRYGNKQFCQISKELEDYCNSVSWYGGSDDERAYAAEIRRRLNRQYLPSWDNVQ